MTDRYAVIGNPISHSKSPILHAAFARQTHQDISYEAILGPMDRFRETVLAFRNSGGKGMNVTVPFKVQALELADVLTPRAKQARAVNTLTFDQHGIYGDNTDGIGLVRDIQERLDFCLQGKRILILGAGGAARGVILPILDERPEHVALANRTIEKALSIQQQFAEFADIPVGTFDDFAGESFDLIINATSAGLSGSHLPLPKGIFSEGAMAYDMVYGKEPTYFLTDAISRGVSHVSDGLGMLVGQAAESFMLWRGVHPDPAPVLKMLQEL